MARLTGNLNLQAGDKGFNLQLPSSSYEQIFDLEQTIDNSISAGVQFDPTSFGLNSLKSANLIVLNNPSDQPIEVQLKLNAWTPASASFTDATCDYNNDPTVSHDANSNIKAGLLVSGTGIPANAMVAFVNSSTGFELADATTGLPVSTTGGSLTNQTLTFTGMADDSGASDFAFPTTILRPNEFMVLPSNQMISYSTNTAVGDTGTYTLTKASTGYSNSGAFLVSALDTTDGTTLAFHDEGAYIFQAGDIIQLGKASDTANNFREVMEVVSRDSSTNITVKRAQFGTSAGDSDVSDYNVGHAVNAPVFFSYYNTSEDVGAMVNASSVEIIATNRSGNFSSKFMPLDGTLSKLRNQTNEADGLVKGSLAISFYTEGAYQELGMSGITNSTESGLTASTLYGFNITVDGGSTFTDLSFTLGTNTKFGGSDGVIQKIQDALDTQYYTAGNLFKKGVSVGIVNGDIRFTSRTNWSTSAIALASATGSGGVNNIFGVGRVPAIGSIETAVASFTPDTTITVDGKSMPNTSAFAYDDGYGNIYGACNGTIDYASSAVTLRGAPPEAEFKVAFNFDSALSSGNNVNAYHSLRSVVCRSLNQHKYATIQILAFN